MPTMIPVQVTQTQEEYDNTTMALPLWEDFFVPEIAEIAQMEEFAEIAEIAEVAEVAEVAGVAEIAQIPELQERRLTQKTLKFFEFKKKSAPTHELRPVDEHARGGNTFVKTHMRKMKKTSKAKNSKKKTEKAKHGAFPRMPVGYEWKEDYDACFSSHLVDKLALCRGTKKY